VFNLVESILLPSSFRLASVLFMVALASAPLVPIIGFHVSQARRLFGAGYTLGDLRTALGVAKRERDEDESLASTERITRSQSMLRVATYASLAGTLYMTFFYSAVTTPGVIKLVHRGSWILSFILLTLSNIDRVPLLPAVVRRIFRVGMRERLWGSRIGAWLAKRLGAPATSQPVGAGVFRATEAALGLAAADLYAALPRAYREQLAELPATVAALESRAAEARAQVEALDAMAPPSGSAGDVLAARREAAKRQLATSVAALEGIRLDLLRLHAGTSDLAPLTTLLDAAKLLGDDLDRLAGAQREVRAKGGLPPAALDRRIATPR
jgi:serine/threonine-protein kinase